MTRTPLTGPAVTAAPVTAAPVTAAPVTGAPVSARVGGAPVRTVLDPTSERTAAARQPSARLGSLEGRRVGLLDISKARGDVFLDRLADLMTQRGALVQRYRKPTFTKPAPVDLRQEIATQCEAVIEALAD